MTSQTPREPVTLQQAHAELRRQRPGVAASPARWRVFHERAAEVYSSVAELDGDHHFEALAWAAMAREDAEKCGGPETGRSSGEAVIGPRTA
jgi:hypothetical protein